MSEGGDWVSDGGGDEMRAEMKSTGRDAPCRDGRQCWGHRGAQRGDR